YMVSFAYLAMVMAMSFDMVSDAVRVPQLTQEIKINEKRWRDLLENVHLAVIAINPKGFISYTNPFFEKLSGYSVNSLRDKALVTLIPEDERKEFTARLEQATKTGPRPHSQWTIVCASGEQRQLAWSSVRQNDNNGEFAGILAVGADITDRLNAQRELQQSQRELERLTRASMLGELASALAHELNQPLAAILSNSQAALRFMENDQVDLNELREILQDIVRDDKHAGEIIHSMRNMLRKGEIKREKFDIKHALDEVVTMLHNEFDDLSIRVDIDLAEDLPLLEAGRVEIQQVLMNLLLNSERALLSMPEKQRYIGINARYEDNMIIVTVSDRGSGIDPGDFPNIFTAFYSTKYAGIGMGLAICKRIVDAHGGKIWAENNPLGGAVIIFTLPVHKSHG
ncbi:sensor histidine kinase, partial [Kaarinaea lacus]